MTQAATPTSAKEMLAYRDQIVKSLKDQLDLLKELKEQGVFDKDDGIFTKQNYPEKISIIEGEIKKLENFDVVLAVVGTMKAGKSTTINAIVGHEILPNRNRPMTALPTLIYHTPNQSTPKLTFNNPKVNGFVENLQQLLNYNSTWRDNQELGTEEMQALISKIIQGWIFEKVYEGEEKIFEFLADLNDLVRLSETLRCNYKEYESKLLFPFNECKNIDQLPKIEVAFRYLSDMKENQGRLILLDTPGPNEAGQEHLRTMLTDQLQRSSAVLLVLDYTQLKSDASQEVKEQLEQVPTIERDRLFALVNKFDQKTANSDNEEQTKQLIFNDFLKNRVELKHIFPLAAQHAFLANRMTTELEINGKPAWDENSWMGDFIKLAYGTMEQDEWDEETIDDIHNKVSRLIKRSKVQAPLDTAIVKTQLEAPRIAIQAALKQLHELFEDIKNFCEIRLQIAKKATADEVEQLQQALERLKNHIKTLEELQKSSPKKLEEIKNQGKKKAKDSVKEFEKKLIGEVRNIFQKKQEQYKENFDKQHEDINTIWKYWTTFKTNKEMNDMFREESKWKASKGDSFVFDTTQEKDKFIKSLHELYQEFGKSINDAVNKMFKEDYENFKKEFSQITLKTQEIINKISKEFSQENIELEFTLPDIKDFFSFKSDSDLNFQFNSYNKDYEKSGFWNACARFFNIGGYEKRTSYSIKKESIVEIFQKNLSTNFKKCSDESIIYIYDSNTKHISDYIQKVMQRVGALIDETNRQIEETSNFKGNQEERLEQIRQLQERNNNIHEDITNIKKKFLN